MDMFGAPYSNKPLHTDWHVLHCLSQCMTQHCSHWRWNDVLHVPKSSIWNRDIAYSFSGQNVSSVCVWLGFTWCQHGDARGRWRKQFNRRVTCGRFPQRRCLRKCTGMQRWWITVNTPLSCPNADSQALHSFTPLGSRCKPGRLLQTHTRSINTQLCTNLRGTHAALQTGLEPTYRCRGFGVHAPKHWHTCLFDTSLWSTRRGRW